jgi:hypothetical protein
LVAHFLVTICQIINQRIIKIKNNSWVLMYLLHLIIRRQCIRQLLMRRNNNSILFLLFHRILYSGRLRCHLEVNYYTNKIMKLNRNIINLNSLLGLIQWKGMIFLKLFCIKGKRITLYRINIRKSPPELPAGRDIL